MMIKDSLVSGTRNSDDSLTIQEERLIECAARGRPWTPDRIKDRKRDLNPANAGHWDPSRAIRASVIRCLAAGDIWPGNDKAWPVGPKGVQNIGARITGKLDLKGAIINRTLRLHSCAFDRSINLISAKTRTISLTRSRIPGLDAQQIRIEGNLRLLNGFKATGQVNLNSATIEGQLVCSGGRFENPNGPALFCNETTVTLSVFLNDGFTAAGEVNLIGARIEGFLICSNGHLKNIPAAARLTATP